jgi:hypothetical protein
MAKHDHFFPANADMAREKKEAEEAVVSCSNSDIGGRREGRGATRKAVLRSLATAWRC